MSEIEEDYGWQGWLIGAFITTFLILSTHVFIGGDKCGDISRFAPLKHYYQQLYKK